MLTVLFCGSRTVSDRARIQSTIDAAIKAYGPFAVIEGGARGADSLAGDYARRVGLSVTTHRAEWDRYGKSAGYRRNGVMLRDLLSREGERVVVAFVDKPLADSRGTAMMVQLADKAGVRTVVIETA